MKRNSKGIALMKVIFPIIFISYICSISFFTHNHIVGGVTIVHSHFYTSDTDAPSGHEHTCSEIQLIQTLSHFTSDGYIYEPFSLNAFLSVETVFSALRYISVISSFVDGGYFLRPPPVLQFV
ncbi:hypothetical protein M2132_000532 [Dysgonomonas sp. PH5-45]|uniref:hypothetical protein n=1 Tax=unclassified Dysgonomonas TaxID=2630389 RepID=UPI002476856A|nr:MULTISPECIES: hypothetical protein [unclassified Dysgonomonas]MDH6354205.1 hypothetical protein [Dysgonomonas sp. PH5-45]MDH6387106.1 hypothetical protein [Dysgonomonas sp. PH5-37]